MPLQNRVSPFGELIAHPARGTLMGNRGVLHNNRQEIIRPYKLKAWIICRLEFKRRKRAVMAPNRYTELFFLDEATALAAGHRPCFECQRERALAFRDAWTATSPDLINPPRMKEIDDVLHKERLTQSFYLKNRHKRTYSAALDSLPDGAFITLNQIPHLIWGVFLFPWTPFGYGPPLPRPAGRKVDILTPPLAVAALAHGYAPIIHQSAKIAYHE